MTDQQHPVTPPPELQEEWLGLWPQDALLQAARWGADMELEACCEWLARETPQPYINALRAARRPKARSLKESALLELSNLVEVLELYGLGRTPSTIYSSDTIRAALERLQELEGQG